jgi:hypothetical protein
MMCQKKKPRRPFGVRGLSNEPSSSSQTPAPVAVEYYRKGVGVGFHLSLMKNRARMIGDMAKACQRSGPAGGRLWALFVASDQRAAAPRSAISGYCNGRVDL